MDQVQRLKKKSAELDLDCSLLKGNLEKIALENEQRRHHLQAIRMKNSWLKKNIERLEDMGVQATHRQPRLGVKDRRKELTGILVAGGPQGQSGQNSGKMRKSPLEARLQVLKLQNLRLTKQQETLNSELTEYRNSICLILNEVKQEATSQLEIIQNLEENLEAEEGRFNLSLQKYESLLEQNIELHYLKNNFNSEKERAQQQLIDLENELSARKRQCNNFVRQGINDRMRKVLSAAKLTGNVQ